MLVVRKGEIVCRYFVVSPIPFLCLHIRLKKGKYLGVAVPGQNSTLPAVTV